MDSKQLNDKIEDTLTDPVDRLLQEKKPASTGKWMVMLALLLALAAVGASGWQWWQAWSAGMDGLSQQETIALLEEKQSRLADSVSSFQAQLDAAESPVNRDEFSSLGDKLSTVEHKITGLQGQSSEDIASIAAAFGDGGIRPDQSCRQNPEQQCRA